MEEYRNKAAELSLEMNRQRKSTHRLGVSAPAKAAKNMSIDTNNIIIGEKITDNIGGR
jgi:hypothetical protein